MSKINKAFVLAAGMGTRMRPLTDNLPKPMIEVQGRTMIDRALDKLVEYGVTEAVVNTHYKAEILVDHLAKRRDLNIQISYEPVRLETGGGILNALDLIGDEPFFVITSDIVWQDAAGQKTALQKLADNWDDRLVGELLLHPLADAYGYEGLGDFDLEDGKMTWRAENSKAQFVFTGLQILHPQVFDRKEVKELGDNFPLNKIYKLYLDDYKGIENDGKWYHIGTPDALRQMPKV